MRYLRWNKLGCNIYVVGITEDNFHIIIKGSHYNELAVSTYTKEEVLSWTPWVEISPEEVQKLKLEML